MNGITIKKEIFQDIPDRTTFILALFKDLGCHVSSMPDSYPTDLKFTNNIEIFDPEKVSNVDELPEYWKLVYQIHNKPIMRDCVDLRYRYIHVPYKIICGYPKIPCSGIFVIERYIDLRKKIHAIDLININNELIKGE